MVAVTPLVAAKLALCDAMRAQGVTNVALAERLGISEGAVRRLVNQGKKSTTLTIQMILQIQRLADHDPRDKGPGS